jgi:hypothetical protein
VVRVLGGERHKKHLPQMKGINGIQHKESTEIKSLTFIFLSIHVHPIHLWLK